MTPHSPLILLASGHVQLGKALRLFVLLLGMVKCTHLETEAKESLPTELQSSGPRGNKTVSSTPLLQSWGKNPDSFKHKVADNKDIVLYVKIRAGLMLKWV